MRKRSKKSITSEVESAYQKSRERRNDLIIAPTPSRQQSSLHQQESFESEDLEEIELNRED